MLNYDSRNETWQLHYIYDWYGVKKIFHVNKSRLHDLCYSNSLSMSPFVGVTFVLPIFVGYHLSYMLLNIKMANSNFRTENAISQRDYKSSVCTSRNMK